MLSFSDTRRLLRTFFKEPVVIYKSKGENMYSLQQKIISVYKKNGITKSKLKISQEAQECMNHGKVFLFV